MANGDGGFNDTVVGLLGNPAFTTGIGLLSGALDRRPVGQTLAQGLEFGVTAAQAGQQVRAQRLALQQLAQQRQQQSALNDLISTFSSGAGVVPSAGPGAVARLAASAAGTPPAAGAAGAAQPGGSFNINPSQAAFLRLLPPEQQMEVITSLLFPEEQRARGLEGRFQALEQRGVEITPEVALELAGGGEDPTQALLASTQALQAQLSAQLTRERVLAAQEERGEREQAQIEQGINTKRGLVDLSGTIGDIEQQLSILEGTPLEPGSGVEPVARFGAGIAGLAGRLTGLDTERATQLATSFDRLNQLTSGAAIEQSLQVLREVGVISDTKFNAVRKTILDPAATPGAIRSALADIAESTVRAGRDQGIELPELEGLIPQLRGERPGAGTVRNLGTGEIRPLSPAEERELEALRRSQGAP
jgi:hypothetical protein